jgi:nucleotide-binding universal stress UspA family protein
MKKILVPTDFSTAATWAINVAADIASKSGAMLVLLNVIEQETKQSFNVQGEIDVDGGWENKLFVLKMIERNKSLFEEIIASLEAKGVVAKSMMRVGNAYHGISEIITEQEMNLVVMGASGQTTFEKLFIGSNTEKVVRSSKCPVLTVHSEPADLGYKNIVYATSMAEDEQTFSDVIKRAQEIYDGTLHLVRINTPGNFTPDTVIIDRMNQFARKLNLKNFTTNIFNDLSEEQGIIHFAESIQADFIGMATHGRTGFLHLWSESLSEGVVNHSRKPVLTFLTSNQ